MSNAAVDDIEPPAVHIFLLKLVTAIAISALVAGCGGRPGGLQDAARYDASSLTKVKMPDDTYRVFEHPAGDRIMTTTSVGKAAGQGFVSGATLGLANVETPEQGHEAAARRHLDLTGRAACSIRAGYELVRVQYEFLIDCPADTVAARPQSEPA